jgi:hypothetical protein
MNSFDFANESLRQDLTDYAYALRTIVTSVPLAQELCDRVVKETRMAQALLAFYDGPEASDLSRLAVRLANLWPYRGETYARTLGFSDEICEAQAFHQEALRGASMVASQDTLAREIALCFQNIADYMKQEQRLLEECHLSIQPHIANMDMTRKRLQLLAATVDARLPSSDEQQEMLRAYTQAARLLREWESGVPLNEEGAAILEQCLDLLEQTRSSVQNHWTSTTVAVRQLEASVH